MGNGCCELWGNENYLTDHQYVCKRATAEAHGTQLPDTKIPMTFVEKYLAQRM